LQQLNIFFAQADEILPKINALKQYYVHKQELLYFRLCSSAVMWHIPPPNSSPPFEVFPLGEIGDIFVCGNRLEYDV